MTDLTKPHLYRVPRLDHVEDIEKYRPGGYHPVNLDDILDSKYKVILKLGHGGFATIWLARVLQDNRHVALKILTANASNQELTILTYLRDRGANHCNITCLRNAFTVRGPNGLHQCLVLDFAGPSLKQIANGKHKISGLMARNAARQVTEGLAHLHSTGVCHGGKTLLMPQKTIANVSLDLTSSNILFELNNFDIWSDAEIYEQLGKPRTAPVLLQSGAAAGPHAPAQVIESIQYTDIDEKWLTGGIRIIDFGESFFINSPPPKFLGTPASYLAPEMAFGWPASVASDVWALGCLAFELQASRPLICLFFGRVDEALAEIVHTLGPLPKAWRESYIDKTRITKFQPGQKDPLFDPIDMRHPLEHLVSIIKLQLSTEEIANFHAFLRGALEYEPSARLSAKQLVMHLWLVC